MGKNKKKKKHNNYQFTYVVSGVTDIDYKTDESGHKSVISIGDVYLLGLFNNYDDVTKYLSNHNAFCKDEHLPIGPFIKEYQDINYIVVEASIPGEFIFMDTDTLTTFEHRSIYKFDEDNGYILVTHDTVSEDFMDVFRNFYENEEFYDVLNSMVINLANSTFMLVDDELFICDKIDELDIPFDDDDTPELTREDLKELISKIKDTEIVVNGKKIKTEEDLNMLDDADIKLISDICMKGTHIDIVN